MFRILFLQSDSRAFNRRLMEKVFEKYRAQSSIKDPLLAEYEYVFIVSGVIGLLGAWIEEDFPISVEKFSETVLKLALMAAQIERTVQEG